MEPYEEIEDNIPSIEGMELQQNNQSKWKVLSSIHLCHPLQIDELDMLDQCDL